MSQRRIISYQGEAGANSHIIAAQRYPDWDPMPCASFEDAFARVVNGDAGLAMIPIDNSVAGRVADIHHLLPSSRLHIVAEHYLRVQHSLVGVPGATLADIKTVHSHVHALGQCRATIRRHGWAPVVAGDTAGAAREIAEAGDRSRAAISPPLAAEIYGLDVLLNAIEDEVHNTTRFVVLSREPIRPTVGSGPTITTFVFNVRNIPAALYKALGGFATNAVNMTKLESYMVGGGFTATQFLAEVEGHPDDPALARALDELAFYTTDITVLGVYPANALRSRWSEEYGLTRQRDRHAT